VTLGNLTVDKLRHPYLKVVVFQNPRWRPKWGPKKWKHAFSYLSLYEVSKNV